ncbi:ATP synthase subunit O, mitochondrial [Cinnamomum micranthum f. kanehirae]|uniref:ATP synthase subunit O, mitochondrial n=1 Tax=Cinnamomum micranthum f. kanehirae TaxID=337451 RepID=A0A3S3NMQ9_9MAGN|nr:ATP synthase subunit O, mitochondrial [Cinnamomum micranthum f. kanehirae]
MAFAGRLRSNISVFQMILRTESVLAQRTVPQRSHGIPDFALAKVCLGMTVECRLRSAPLKSLRNYASAPVSKEEKVKVPLALFGVSGNYASALFLAASKANILDKVESEILDIVEASKKSPVFSQFIKDLSVPGETRVKAVQEIFSEAGFSDITKNFLAVLAENGRLRHIESIAKSFVELTMAHRGEVKAIVTTVIPLPLVEEKQLKATLQDIFGRGKTVKLEQKINQSILGGLVVEFGQKLFDMSFRTRVRQMEKLLRDPVNLESL